MPTKYYEGKIPFRDYPEMTYMGKVTREKHSDQLDYATSNDRDVVWKDNVQFFARLTIDTMSRGRSAANFIANISEVEVPDNPEMSDFLEGKRVNLFMIDMLDIVKGCILNYGTTSTILFTFCKRGMSYGLKRVQ